MIHTNIVCQISIYAAKCGIIENNIVIRYKPHSFKQICRGINTIVNNNGLEWNYSDNSYDSYNFDSTTGYATFTVYCTSKSFVPIKKGNQFTIKGKSYCDIEILKYIYNYTNIYNHKLYINKEIIQRVYNPNRLTNICSTYNILLEDYLDII